MAAEENTVKSFIIIGNKNYMYFNIIIIIVHILQIAFSDLKSITDSQTECHICICSTAAIFMLMILRRKTVNAQMHVWFFKGSSSSSSS